jgi:hypothetical protein
MNTYVQQNNFLSSVDRFISQIEVLTSLVNFVADRMVPKITAKGENRHCYGGNPICSCYGTSYCAWGPRDDQTKWCFYKEYVRYYLPGGSCLDPYVCYNGCDCYKIVPINDPCPGGSGCVC